MAENNDSLQEATSQILCAKGCGFFGSASTMNMCSKCFREHQKSSGDVPTSSAAPTAPGSASPSVIGGPSTPLLAVSTGAPSPAHAPAAVPVLASRTDAPSVPGPVVGPAQQEQQPFHEDPENVEMRDVDEFATPGRKIQKNRGRCFSCKKKIGLTGFECKCGYTFCSSHRHSDQHQCHYDHKSEALDKLARENPMVIASKIDKI